VPRLSKKQKILITVAAIILLALIVVGYVVAYRYKAIIHKAIPVAVADATDSLYRISVKNVSINIMNRSVTLKGVHLWADSAEIARRNKDSMAKPLYVDVVVPRLTVSGIMWDKLTGGEGYSCANFSIIKPEIRVYKTDTALTIYDTTAPAPIEREFTASTVVMKAANIRYAVTVKSDTNTLQLKNCNIEMDNWEMGEESIKDTSRFLLAERAVIDVNTLLYSPPASDYHFSMAHIRFSTDDNKLTARNLKLNLKTSREEFLSKLDRQKEMYELNLPTVELTGINRYKLLEKGELHIAAVHLNHSKLDILMDRRLPPNTKSKMGNYPNQLLQKLKLPLYVKVIKIHDGSLTYSEIVEKTDQKGSIHFNNISGSLANITNIPYWVQKNNHCIVKLGGKFNKYTDTRATFRFVLDDPKGTFAVEARMGALQGRQINEQTKAFTNVEIKSFNMKSMNLQLTGDEHQAHGSFTMLYNNLGIRILKKPENIEDGKRKKGLLTFIANNMVLYSNNPMPGEEVRKVQTKVERDEMKSFFNLVWKNILQGVQNTAIRDLEVIDWIRNNEQEAKDNQTQIREFFTKDRQKAKERKERRKERERNR
jgi:hypothetical protein